MSAWELRFEPDCAVLDFGKKGRFEFHSDRIVCVTEGNPQEIPLDALDSVSMSFPALPAVLRPFQWLRMLRRYDVIPDTLIEDDDAFAWRSWCNVGYVGPDRGWRLRETQVKNGHLQLGVDVHHIELHNSFQWRSTPWRRRATYSSWLGRYIDNPDVVSNEARFKAWDERVGPWPTGWALDRAWRESSGQTFSFTASHYLEVAEWVGFFVLNGAMIAAAAAAAAVLAAEFETKTFELLSAAGVLAVVSALLLYAGLACNRFRMTLDPALRPDRFRWTEEVRRAWDRLRGRR